MARSEFSDDSIRHATVAEKGRPDGGFNLVQVLAVGLSFVAGILIVMGVVASDVDDNAFAPSEEAHAIVGEGEVVARAVGDPDTPFRADSGTDIVAEVAGVTCETQELTERATSLDVLEAWNSAVVAAGDACVAPFGDTLGLAWEMTDAEVSIFGSFGSLYEFSNTQGPVDALSIFLVVEDSLNNEVDELRSLIDSVWGTGTVDWENDCSETSASWSGLVAPDGLAIELANCTNA